MSTLLAHILVSGVLQLGIIPGHGMALYDHLDDFILVNIRQTCFVDYTAEAEIYKYVFLNGGFTSYSLPALKGFDFYPFRADYTMGAGLRAGRFELGWYHGCYHPIAPCTYHVPLPKIDASTDLFYLKIKIGGKPL
jgi:hypothetical protein